MTNLLWLENNPARTKWWDIINFSRPADHAEMQWLSCVYKFELFRGQYRNVWTGGDLSACFIVSILFYASSHNK